MGVWLITHFPSKSRKKLVLKPLRWHKKILKTTHASHLATDIWKKHQQYKLKIMDVESLIFMTPKKDFRLPLVWLYSRCMYALGIKIHPRVNSASMKNSVLPGGSISSSTNFFPKLEFFVELKFTSVARSSHRRLQPRFKKKKTFEQMGELVFFSAQSSPLRERHGAFCKRETSSDQFLDGLAGVITGNEVRDTTRHKSLSLRLLGRSRNSRSRNQLYSIYFSFIFRNVVIGNSIYT